MPLRNHPNLSRRMSVSTLLAAGLIAFAIASTANSQDVPATVPSSQPSLIYTTTAAENKHLDRQAEVALGMVDDALKANPPGPQISAERGLALTLFDAILHDPAAPGRPTIGAYRTMRTQHAIDDIRRTKVTDDSVIIWQIYNMGFVVRTRSVTLAFDLVELSHVPALALDDASMKAIVDQCDVLFVSHEHLDHADHKVAKWFLDAGKPVLAPDAMWKGEPIHDALTHLPREGSSQARPLPIGHGKSTLSVSIYPGFQNIKDGTTVENNVYVITTAEGFRIAHTGDNNDAKGLPTTKRPIPPVDVLIMKFEPGNLKQAAIIPPFKPGLVLPSHFEELGHANVNGREPFWRGMERAAKVDFPTVLMTWGERLKYVRANP